VAATFEIRELPKGLSLRVTEPKRVGRILLSAVFGIAGTLFFIYVPSSTLLKIFLGGFCVFSVIRSLTSGLRGADVELVVTNLDFKSTGHAPEGYKPSITARADIYNMEFREASGGGDDPERPKGLYIESHGGLWTPAICVLPHIDKIQTQQVIEAVYQRFPDTCTLSPTGPFEPYLTSLNLNKR
jgi:hypothetical protein